MSAPDPLAPEMPRPGAGDALRDELVAALDHDLRTALTTVLGALQTMARPELAPADPDLGQLLSAGLAQAQRLRRLLDELPGAVSAGRPEPLPPTELAHLISQAADAVDGVAARVEVPGDLPPVWVSAPGLRRALAGTLARGGGGRGARVTVAADGPDCRITITRQGDGAPVAPGFVARLVGAMGGRVEATGDPGAPGLCLIFPGACGAPAA